MSEQQTISPTPLQGVRYATHRLGLSSDHATYTAIREGVLPDGVVVRLGRRVMIDPRALENWISGGGKALPGGWKKEGGRQA